MEIQSTQISWPTTQAFVYDVFSTLRNLGLSCKSATLLTSHIALSTGWGRKVYDYNFAGMKAGTSRVCDGSASATYNPYSCLWGSEFINGVRVDALMPFRSYTSLESGLSAIIKNLQSARYAKAYDYLLAGNPEYFRQVGKDGWYTVSPDTMYSEMSRFYVGVMNYLNLPRGCPDSFASPALPLVLIAVSAVGLWYLITRVIK